MTSLTLNRLGEREAAAIIARLAGNKALPPGVLAEIVERTDGIPLFVEEMTKAVLEAEGEGEARRTVAAVPFPALAIPGKLARVADGAARPARPRQGGGADRGGYRTGILSSGCGGAPAGGGDGIGARPACSGWFAVPSGRAPHATYLFKHALVQEAAYGTLLREPRRTLHARIAEALESQFADIAQSQPELLARHCTAAGQIEKAAGLWANVL